MPTFLDAWLSLSSGVTNVRLSARQLTIIAISNGAKETPPMIAEEIEAYIAKTFVYFSSAWMVDDK